MSNQDVKQIFAKNFRRIMKESGKTQAEVAKHIDSNQSQVSAYLRGQNFPRPDKLALISEYFGVSQNDLFNPYGSIRLHEELPKDYFTNPKRAVEFLLNQTCIEEVTGIKIDELNNQELDAYIEEVLDIVRVLGYRYTLME